MINLLLLLHLHLLYQFLLYIGVFKNRSNINLVVVIDHVYNGNFGFGRRALHARVGASVSLALPNGNTFCMICNVTHMSLRCSLAHPTAVLHGHHQVESLLLVFKLGGESRAPEVRIGDTLAAMRAAHFT